MATERNESTPRVRSRFPGFASLAGDTTELIGDLAATRRRQGLSQTEVAARMGTSQSALARLESGQSDVRMSTIQRYADALNVTIGFAVTEPDSQVADDA